MIKALHLKSDAKNTIALWNKYILYDLVGFEKRLKSPNHFLLRKVMATKNMTMGAG